MFAATAARAEALFSDWGGPGLLQTPSARLPEAGTVISGATLLRGQHRHIHAGVAPLDWLWLGVRQTQYVNDYGLYEPGVDVTLRLRREDAAGPALVLGARDVTGSGDLLPGVGRFAGEYLAASRRWWSLDFSAGIGWGRFAGRAALDNPLRWRRRDRPLTGPGARGPQNWFSGREVGLFGGVAWRTPLDGLVLKAEISSDDFSVERRDRPWLDAPSPVNVGLAWRPPWDGFDQFELGAGLEQGRHVMLRAMLRLGPALLSADRPPPPPAVPRPLSRAAADLAAGLPSTLTDGALPLLPGAGDDDGAAGIDWLASGRRLGLPLRGVTVTAEGATAWLDRPATRPDSLGRDIGRTARWLAGTAAPAAPWLTVAARPQGMAGTAVSLPRERLLQAADGRGSAEELLSAADIVPAAVAGPPPLWDWLRSSLSVAVRVASEESLFEHAAPQAARAFSELETQWTPLPGLLAGATLRRNAGQNLEWLNSWMIPAARPVRSDLADYALGTTLERFYGGLRYSLSPDWHVGLDGGVLEEMFSGYGGEALYWPPQARYAVGASLHRVWKRLPGQLWRVDPSWETVTGHLTGYYQGPGGNWTAAAGVGRYLGRDWGGGATFTRILAGETRLAAHATWTNGPFADQARLGGRLEYGLRLAVPLDALLRVVGVRTPGQVKKYLPVRFDTAVRTLGRDAGQALDRPAPLYETLAPAGYGRLTGTWRHAMD